MKKAKFYRFVSGFLSMVALVVLFTTLVLVYHFFTVDLFTAGSKLQSVGAIGLAVFAFWLLLGYIDDLDEAAEKAMNAEYKQAVYSGLMARDRRRGA